MTSFKPGVKLAGIKPEMAMGFTVIASVFEAHGIPCVVSSGLDSVHAAKSARHPRSLHYEGLALDLRLPGRWTGTAWRDKSDPAIDRAVHAALAAALGPEFDVVLEATHIHVEFDPLDQPTVKVATQAPQLPAVA